VAERVSPQSGHCAPFLGHSCAPVGVSGHGDRVALLSPPQPYPGMAMKHRSVATSRDEPQQGLRRNGVGIPPILSPLQPYPGMASKLPILSPREGTAGEAEVAVH